MKRFLLGLVASIMIAAALIPSVRVKAQVLGSTMAQTFTALTLTNTTNQLVLGTTTTDTLSFTAPGSSRTITFADPGGADSVAYLAASQAFTNKTLSSGNFIGYPAVQSSASLGGSPVTLTAAQCGQAFALDASTGVVYIMPSTFPTAGCTYDFFVTVSVTSNAHEIESGNAAHFLGGSPLMVAAAATAIFQCNGTTHIAYKTNGTTTGGLIGTHIRVTVLSATLAWTDGLNAGSGTLATACSTTN